MPKKRGNLFFDVDARHIRQLGEYLVADRVTALAELVKNAFDADASFARLEFTVRRGDGGVLEVIDDGTGMSLHDVRSKWMRISTDSKEREQTSPKYGRARAGKKGIGRFAAERLGKKLILLSKMRGTRQRAKVTFEWDRFYDAGRLSLVPNAFETEAAPLEEHGTTLRIEGLREKWTRKDFLALSRAVLLLQPPFTEPASPVSAERRPQVDPGFRIVARVNGRPPPTAMGDRQIEEFLAGATAVVSGKVTASGRGEWEMKSARLGVTRSKAAGIVAKNCGPFAFTAHYFIYEAGAIGDVRLSLAQEMGKVYGGVRLYRDGLRIMPYGERRDDWLQLDEESKRRVVLVPIANNNWFGHVSISRKENPQLEDTASREGLIANPAFLAAAQFVRSGLIWGALEVASARKRKGLASDERRPPTTRAKLVKQALAEAEMALVTASSNPATARKALRTAVVRVIREARRDDRREASEVRGLIEELELLRVLASLGTSIAVFSHEIGVIVNDAHGSLLDVGDRLRTLPRPARESLGPLVERIQQRMERLDGLGRYIRGYVSLTKTRERNPLPVREVVSEFFESFNASLNQRGIDVDIEGVDAEATTAPMHRSELDAILINLLTNAIKAMDGERSAARRIVLTAQVGNGEVVLRFQDSGAGIPADIRDRVFDPFVTSTLPRDAELGAGTGLGLKIVWDIASSNRGSVCLAEADRGLSTCVELRLPAQVKREE